LERNVKLDLIHILPFLKPYLMYIAMYGLGVSLMLGYLINRITNQKEFFYTDKILSSFFVVSYIIAIAFSILYLTYPNYIDHVEPIVANLGYRFKRGEAVYPPLDSYTFHGIVYGPLLAELEAIFIGVTADPILNSKLPTVLSFVIFSLICLVGIKNVIARGYLISLIPFGYYLIWTRSEPVLLLFCALSWVAVKVKKWWTPFFLGFIFELSFAMKIHGVIYILPFLLLAIVDIGFSWNLLYRFVVIFVIGFILGFLICFGYNNVSWWQYIEYLKLTSQHTISYDTLERNIFYFIFSLAPIIFLSLIHI
jgi:hypothetical protein